MLSEREILVAGLEMIEEVSADAQSLHPQEDWKESQDAVCFIYELVHTIRTPGCRKNHPEWLKNIEAKVRADRRRAAGRKRGR
jgi:hypothetical protein